MVNFIISVSLVLFLSAKAHAEKVLFIGDSHTVGHFGTHFDQNLRFAGHSVVTVGSCGSIPRWWSNGQETNCGFFSKDLSGTEFRARKAPTPLMSDLLLELSPKIVVMEFGGNYLNYLEDEFVIKDIKKIVSLVTSSGATCFWITNPDSRNNRHALPRILNLIREGVGSRCTLFVSSTVTRYPDVGGDGVHYWGTEGYAITKSWADLAFEAFLDFEILQRK